MMRRLCIIVALVGTIATAHDNIIATTRRPTNSDGDDGGGTIRLDPRHDCRPRTLHPVQVSDIVPAPDQFTVHFDTTIGTNNNHTRLTLRVHRNWAPRGVDRFYQLVRDHYYDCNVFFRVVPNFVVQFGLAAQSDETLKWNVAIADDPNVVGSSNVAGTVSYATAGPNSRTTQIFINLGHNARLDQMGFVPFATVDDIAMLPAWLRNPTPGNSGGMDQDELTDGGNDWVVKNYFPNFDLITNVTVELSATNDGIRDSTNDMPQLTWTRARRWYYVACGMELVVAGLVWCRW